MYKKYRGEQSIGTYEDTRNYSSIPRINIFPYPFYFISSPFSDEPTINPRRAGWSPQYVFQNESLQPDKPITNNCFQSACNTTYTKNVKDKNGNCIQNDCINTDR
jgi:hypothetical protein